VLVYEKVRGFLQKSKNSPAAPHRAEAARREMGRGTMRGMQPGEQLRGRPVFRVGTAENTGDPGRNYPRLIESKK
jgi:hypothetical protein